VRHPLAAADEAATTPLAALGEIWLAGERAARVPDWRILWHLDRLKSGIRFLMRGRPSIWRDPDRPDWYNLHGPIHRGLHRGYELTDRHFNVSCEPLRCTPLPISAILQHWNEGKRSSSGP
jgi:hypothetical protein